MADNHLAARRRAALLHRGRPSMPSLRPLAVLVALSLTVAALQGQAPQTPQTPPTPPAAPAPAPAPADQPPVFRAGVEVLPIDVTVLDREGRQVTDLTTAEFQVEVDGKARKVLRLGVHQADRPAHHRPAPPDLRQPRGRGRARHRHLDQRRERRGAGARHPAARRPGQHPLRLGAPGDAERAQVRRSPPAQRPHRAGRSAGPRRTRRLHARPRQGARGDAARHRPAHLDAAALQRVADRSLRDLPPERRAPHRASDAARVLGGVRRRRPGTLRARRRTGGRRDRRRPASADRPLRQRDSRGADQPRRDGGPQVGDPDLGGPGARRPGQRTGRSGAAWPPTCGPRSTS